MTYVIFQITKLYTEMFHNASCRSIYFGVKRSKVKAKTHKKTLPAWVFALLLVLASSSYWIAEVVLTSMCLSTNTRLSTPRYSFLNTELRMQHVLMLALRQAEQHMQFTG